MEYDRYQQNHGMYFLAIISLIVSLVLLTFTAYILPYLLWELRYKVPYVVTYLLAVMQEDYAMRLVTSKLSVFLLFAVPGFLAGLLAYYASNRIENALFHEETHTEEEGTEPSLEAIRKKTQDRRDSIMLTIKILLLMFLLVSTILFIQSII
jgi:hypothetical protein